MLVKMMLNKILRTVSTLVILDMHDTKKDCFGYRMEKTLQVWRMVMDFLHKAALKL